MFNLLLERVSSRPPTEVHAGCPYQGLLIFPQWNLFNGIPRNPHFCSLIQVIFKRLFYKLYHITL